MRFLKSIYIIPELIKHNTYPFTIPLFSQAFHYDFGSDVTLFVGENGSGKSTLLEAIASKCDFHTAGGGRNQRYTHHKSESPLADALRLSWSPKVTEVFFCVLRVFTISPLISTKSHKMIYVFTSDTAENRCTSNRTANHFLVYSHIDSPEDYLFLMSLRQRYHPNGNLHSCESFTN